MKRPFAPFVAFAAAHLSAVFTSGAEPSAPPSKKTAAPAPKSAPSAPTPSPTAPENVQRMEREFGERSQDLIQKRKLLLERLRLAQTEEEKQRIIAELRRQQQERVDQQRELARQIREQMQNKRGDSRAASPGG